MHSTEVAECSLCTIVRTLFCCCMHTRSGPAALQHAPPTARFDPLSMSSTLPFSLLRISPLSARRRRMAERVRHLGRAHPSGMLFWGGVKEFAGKHGLGCLVHDGVQRWMVAGQAAASGVHAASAA